MKDDLTIGMCSTNDDDDDSSDDDGFEQVTLDDLEDLSFDPIHEILY